jgi:Zn-dependent protease with chaperone function
LGVPGWLYDGSSAVRREVEARASERGGLDIRFADGAADHVPGDALRHMETRRDGDVYGRTDIAGWRLGLTGTAEEIAAVLPRPQKYGRWIDRAGLVPSILIALAISAAVLFGADRFPALAAPYVPASWEKKFGDALVGDFGGRFCTGAAGQAALRKLARELSPDADRLNIRIVHVPIVNAAALPGGNIVIFDKLLAESPGPDAVAGVLAHEMGHVRERHVTQAMIREFGFSALISVLGGSAGSGIDTLGSLHYSRGAEAQADGDAIATLRRAGISPGPTADFFHGLAEQEKMFGRADAALGYVSTHPLTADREARFRASAVRDAAYRPSLSPEEWAALSTICSGSTVKGP